MNTPFNFTKFFYKLIFLISLFISTQVSLFAATSSTSFMYGITYKDSKNHLHAINSSTGGSSIIKSFDTTFISFQGNYNYRGWTGSGAIDEATDTLYITEKNKILSINLSTGNSSEYILDVTPNKIFVSNSKVYVLASNGSSNTLYSFHNGLTSLGTIAQDIGSSAIVDNTSKLYINSPNNKILEYDLDSGSLTNSLDQDLNINKLFAADDNFLYAISSNKLYKIDPSNGNTSLINTLDFSGTYWMNTATIDKKTKKLYLISKDDHKLYSFNLSDGTLIEKKTIVGSIQYKETVQSLHTFSKIISNSTPTDILLTSSNILENEAVNTVVGSLSAADDDYFDNHTYSFDCNGEDDNSFTISGNTLKTAESFDFETKSSYSICVKVNDGTTTFNKTFDINVLNANDAPSSSNFTTSINEDESKIFSPNDFTFVDADSGDTLHEIVISSLESSGSLTLDGVDVTLNQVISKSDISKLKFTPTLNANGNVYSTFKFKVNDSTNNSLEYTATINVLPVDDAPVLQSFNNLNYTGSFDKLNLNLVASDAENDPIEFSVNSSIPSIATAAIKNGKLEITQGLSKSVGTTIISVTVKANGLTHTQTFTLTVESSSLSKPVFGVSLSSSTILPNNVSTLKYTFDNTLNSTPASDVNFSTTLPVGVTISGANATSDCFEPTISANQGESVISFSTSRIAGTESCSFSVDITSSTIGIHTITSSNLISSGGSSGDTSVNLTVDNSSLVFLKSLSPSTINVGDEARLTLTLNNSSDTNITNLTLSDSLPQGLTISQNPDLNISSGCNGTPFTPTITVPYNITANPSSSSIYANYLSVYANESCTISMNVTPKSAGTYKLSSTTINPFIVNNENGILTVIQPDFEQKLSKNIVIPDEIITLQFNLTNNDRDNTLSNISFSENLDNGLNGLIASSLPANGFCGSNSTVSGTSSLSFSNLSIDPQSSCSFELNLTVPSNALSGDYNISTSAVTANLDSTPVNLPAMSSTFKVQLIPTLTKTFIDNPASSGDDVTIRYTITNTDSVNNLTEISFKDEVASLGTIKVMPAFNSCGTGSTFTQGADPLSLDVSNANILASESCTFDLLLTLGSLSSGEYSTSTSTISATSNGETLIGYPATANLTLVSAPRLSLSVKEPFASADSNVTLEFKLNYSENATADANDIEFSIDLNNAMLNLVSVTEDLNNICGINSSLSGSDILTFTGGSLSPGEECDFNITAKIPSDTQMGEYTITSSTVTATVEGNSVQNISTSDTINVSGLKLSHSFIPHSVFPNDETIINFKLENLSIYDASSITFSNEISKSLSGLSATSLPAEPCGVGSSITGTTTLTASNMSLLAKESCEFNVTVRIPENTSVSDYNNVTNSVFATINGLNTVHNTSVANFEVTEFLTISNEFNESSVFSDENITMIISLKNNHPTKALTNLAFTDNLDDIFTGLSAVALNNNSCNGTVSLGSELSLANGTLDSNGTCSIEVTLNMAPPSTFSSYTKIYTNSFEVSGSSIDGVNFTTTSPQKSDSIDIKFKNILFSKSYLNDGALGESVILNYKIENISDKFIEGISFKDDLPNDFNGSGLSLNNICGIDSIIKGDSTLFFSKGALSANSSCDFNVSINIAQTATQGVYSHETSELYSNGSVISSGATTEIKIGVLSDFTKEFSPNLINSFETSVLTYTIDNTANEFNTTALSFSDNLPDGLIIASEPNISNTCNGGTLTAIAGSNTISYNQGMVLAGESCTISVTIDSNNHGIYSSSSSVLSSSFGNGKVSTDILTVNNIPTLSNITTAQLVNDNETIKPFSNININDIDDDNISVAITLDDNTKGTLSGTALIKNNDGTYSITSDTLNNIKSKIKALVFTPTNNKLIPGATETTTFTIVLNDGIENSLLNTDTKVTSTSINDAPVITSNGGNDTANINITENQTTVTTVSSSDSDFAHTKSYSIKNSYDSGKFKINNTSGVLSFIEAPSYESALDTDNNNIYIVEVEVTDTIATDTQKIMVTVINDNVEMPNVNLSVNDTTILENGAESIITLTLSEIVSIDTVVTIGVKSTSTASLNNDFNLSNTTTTIPSGSKEQNITLLTIDDDIDENTETAIIEIITVSGGENATENGIQEKTISITDNDNAGITLSKTTVSVDENGSSEDFTVVLDTEPITNVVIDISIEDTTEASISSSQLVFTPSNWDTAQTITVTGIDDTLLDGSQNTNIVLSINDDNSDDKYDILSNKTINVNITAVNDAPKIITNLSNITINEDSGSLSYELNVTAIEGSDLNITVESNNTSLITVSKGWKNLLSQNEWENKSLDFNISTVKDGYGVAKITILANDGERDRKLTYDINVTAINDAPVLSDINNTIKIEDFEQYSISLLAKDVDDTNLTYNAISSDESIVEVSIDGSSLIINSMPNANGFVTIDFNVTDGEFSDTNSFDINVTAVDDAPELGTIEDQVTNEDSKSTRIDLSIFDVDHDISEVTYTVKVSDDSIVKARVNKNKHKLIITPLENAFGVVQIEVNATINGLSTIQTLTYTVNSVNDKPIIGTISNVVLDQVAQEQNGSVLFTIQDDGNITNIEAVSLNKDVLADENLNIEKVNENLAQLNYSIPALSSGLILVDILVKDNDGETSKETMIFKIAPNNDALCIENTFTALNFDHFKGENISQEEISKQLILPDTLADICDASISWESSNTNIIDNNGNIYIGNSAKIVEIKANIQKGDFNITKRFVLKVPALNISHEDVLNNITFEQIKLNNLRTNQIVGKLNLIENTLGYSVEWNSTDETIIDPYSGYVTRGVIDQNITITATVDGNTSAIKKFNLIVLAQLISDEEKISNDANWLTFTQILDKNLDNENVIYDLIKPLPEVGPNGSIIEWSTSDISIINTNGDVFRDDLIDKHITLFATINSNGKETIKEFQLRVIKNQVETDNTTEFKNIEQNDQNLSVVYDDNGTESSTFVSFGDKVQELVETVLEQDGVNSVIELAKTVLNLFFSTDGTVHTKSEHLDENNNSLISAIKVNITQSKTEVDENGTVNTTVNYKNTKFKATMENDGKVSHTVDNNETNKSTVVTSELAGSKTEIDKGDIETSAEFTIGSVKYKAVVNSDANGKTSTRFIKVDLTTGEEIDSTNTLSNNAKYSSGNSVKIGKLGDKLYIQTSISIDDNLTFE